MASIPDVVASSSKTENKGQPTLKVACQRCRSMKYRCPGPSAGSPDCSKCIKAKVPCLIERHKRGRKLGTRLTDPEKALIRMKSAFDIIQKAKGGPQISDELAAQVEGLISSRPKSSTPSSSTPSPAVPQTQKRTAKTRRRSNSSSASSASLPPPNHVHPHHDFRPSTSFNPPGLHSTSHSSFPSSSHDTKSHSSDFPLHQPPTPVSPGLRPALPRSLFNFQDTATLPTPQRTSNLDDIGPSSRPSISLASLFSLEEEDDHPTATSQADVEAWRQDPIVLGLLSEASSRELFAMFMDKIDHHLCYFDRVLYTYDHVRETNQLLFATILSISLKFSPYIDPTTRERVRSLAREQVLKIISNGEEQNVESVQALLLMTEFREQNDRQAYFLLGIACRLAMDLNLGQPIPHLDERRNRNRIRCWLNAYSMDRRFAGLGAAGSPSMMSEDWAVRNCTNFHRHPTASIGDARLVAAVELRTLLSRYDALLKTNAEHMQAEGQAPLFNLRDLFLAASSELDTWARSWTAEILIHNPAAFPLELNLCQEHGKLQIAHHWLFQVFRLPNLPWISSEEDWEAERRSALAACIGGSCRILKLMIATPKDMLSYSPDIEHLFYSYATFFLLKMCKAKVLELFDPASIAFIFDLLRLSVAKLEDCTLDPVHTISLHLRLLKSILTAYPQYSAPFAPNALPSLETVGLPAGSLAIEEGLISEVVVGVVTEDGWTGGGGRGGEGTTVGAASGGGEGGLSSVRFPEEDWSEVWLEGGMVDEMSANTGELDFSFFDFSAPN